MISAKMISDAISIDNTFLIQINFRKNDVINNTKFFYDFIYRKNQDKKAIIFLCTFPHSLAIHILGLLQNLHSNLLLLRTLHSMSKSNYRIVFMTMYI